MQRQTLETFSSSPNRRLVIRSSINTSSDSISTWFVKNYLPVLEAFTVQGSTTKLVNVCLSIGNLPSQVKYMHVLIVCSGIKKLPLASKCAVGCLCLMSQIDSWLYGYGFV